MYSIFVFRVSTLKAKGIKYISSIQEWRGEFDLLKFTKTGKFDLLKDKGRRKYINVAVVRGGKYVECWLVYIINSFQSHAADMEVCTHSWSMNLC